MFLNVMRNPDFSSFRVPDHTAVPELSGLNEVVERREVPVRRLDAVPLQTASGTAAQRIFLKLDTQGYDLEVIKGSEGILPSVVALQTEASVRPIYESMPDMGETLETLRGLGFALANVVPVARDSALRAIEFDLLFINNVYARGALDEHGGVSG